jgi:hypothetical protein
LRELVSIDQTGEPNWLFGSEDVADDGLATFRDAEQSADVRSAYATTDRERLWLRVYVSSQQAPTELAVFAFIDADRDAATGGSARAPDIDPVLDTGPSTRGYELALEVRAGAGLSNVYRHDEANDVFEAIDDLEALDMVTDSGNDLDPLRLGSPQNGYLQVALDLMPLSLRVSCDVDFLFRSSAGMDIADRDVGAIGPCVPADENENGLADLAETDAACTSDEQCPARGACRGGQCRAPELVVDPGEVVQGGALSCEMTSSRASWPHAWLIVGLALSAALRRRIAHEHRGHRGS